MVVNSTARKTAGGSRNQPTGVKLVVTAWLAARQVSSGQTAETENAVAGSGVKRCAAWCNARGIRTAAGLLACAAV